MGSATPVLVSVMFTGMVWTRPEPVAFSHGTPAASDTVVSPLTCRR